MSITLIKYNAINTASMAEWSACYRLDLLCSIYEIFPSRLSVNWGPSSFVWIVRWLFYSELVGLIKSI